MDKYISQGKLSEAALKRSVLKQLHKRRKEVVIGAAVGEDCAALRLGSDELFVMSVDPITGAAKDIGALAVHITANDIASSGAVPMGIMVSLLLPVGITESEVRSIMRQMDDECDKIGVEIMGGHTEVTEAVNKAIITVTGVGRVKKDSLILTGGARPGQDIVMTKWAGLEGTSIIAKDKREELLGKFPAELIDRADGFSRYLSVVKEAKLAADTSSAWRISAMHDVTEGGIFGALWEMAEASKVGLTADLRAIPIRQETVEICNFFDINPYMLISSGSMLIAADNGEALVGALLENGIHAALIGHFTDSNDRIVKNKDETRYLEPPRADELYKVL